MAGLGKMPSEIILEICSHLQIIVASKIILSKRDTDKNVHAAIHKERRHLFSLSRINRRFYAIVSPLTFKFVSIHGANPLRKLMTFLRAVEGNGSVRASVRQFYLQFNERDRATYPGPLADEDLELIIAVAKRMGINVWRASPKYPHYFGVIHPVLVADDAIDDLSQAMSELGINDDGFGPRQRRRRTIVDDLRDLKAARVVLTAYVTLLRLSHLEEVTLSVTPAAAAWLASIIRVFHTATCPSVKFLLLRDSQVGAPGKVAQESFFRDMSSVDANRLLSFTPNLDELYLQRLILDDSVSAANVTSLVLHDMELPQQSLINTLTSAHNLVKFVYVHTKHHETLRGLTASDLFTALISRASNMDTIIIDFRFRSLDHASQPPISNIKRFTALENLWLKIAYPMQNESDPNNFIRTLPRSIKRLHLDGGLFVVEDDLKWLSDHYNTGGMPNLEEIAFSWLFRDGPLGRMWKEQGMDVEEIDDYTTW
ncbi:hypothetical protein C8035_v003546 [Colletotrichum spinosum]|uniref:F-box domain-containing protein n=1 Tax=Colletotrichum spinosum TaxID=1347390 RepID=A0A4V3HR16_9PEZI|nr:hypothetical protein C8035_v003546 [Colletotrichum spinosum]